MVKKYPLLKLMIIAVILAAVVPPIIFGEPRVVKDETGGDTWRNILFDFQTLIGGLFAVFAAWWTVITMETTDQAAQERHEQTLAQNRKAEDENNRRHRQLMQLTVRGDMLRVDRLLVPALSNFQTARQQIKDALKYDPESLKKPETLTSEEKQMFDRAGWLVQRHFVDALIEPQWINERDLFNGNLIAALFICENTGRRMVNDVWFFAKTFYPLTETTEFKLELDIRRREILQEIEAKQREAILAIPEQNIILFGAIDNFISELIKLAEIYEVDWQRQVL